MQQHAPHLDRRTLDCITHCSDCHDACLGSATHAFMQDMMPEHTRLLLDCAEICDTSRDFMLRGSDLHPKTCGLCATICRACAEMCEGHDDKVMQACAQVCRRCEQSCAEMAGGQHQSHAA